MANDIQLNTNGSGVLAEIISSDPSGSGSNFGPPDWTQLSAVFGMVRVREMRIRLCFTFTDTKSTGATPIFAAWNLSASSVPSTAAQVADNPGSKMLSPTSTTNAGITMRARWPRGMAYAPVSTPNPGATVISGCPGCLALYASGHAATITLGYAIIEGYYQFTQRY